MSFKTNVWEDGIKFNGVVHPLAGKDLKPYKDKNPAIRPVSTYVGKQTGDVAFDLQSKAFESQNKQIIYINEIDRLRGIDVPWKLYSIGYVFLIIGLVVGVYIGQDSYNLSTNNIVAASAGGLLIITLCFVIITYCGFASEEREDVQKLCDLQNKIKTESQQQLSFQRMNMKLTASNWGRPEGEIDDIFLLRVNQMRCQSNMLMAGSTLIPEGEQDKLSELFTRLHTRMHETFLENAGLIKRIHFQTCGLDEWKAAGTDCKKQMFIIREVFAMHLAIRLFASESVTNYKMISMLAADNLQELIKKCSDLVTDSSFKESVSKASKLSFAEVEAAFVDKFSSPKELLVVVSALNKVFLALFEVFPKREYERVMQLGKLEDPSVDESVSF